MARKGLPASLIRAHHGNMKAAWRAYKSGRKNPSRRRAHVSHRRRGTTRHRATRRRNPTGYPFSGSKFRPVFRRRRGGYRHSSRRSAARGLSGYSIRGSRRGMVGFHSRRRAKHNPARRRSRRYGRRGRRNPEAGFGHFGKLSMGNIKSYIPLARRVEWHMMKENKLWAVVGIGSGLIIGGIMGSAGGTLAVVLTGAAGYFVLRYALKGKHATIAPAFMLGALIAAAANAFSGGSLTGTAKLGATPANLKRLAARVKVKGLSGVGEMSLEGLTGVGQLEQVAARLKAQLAKAGVPLAGVKGLGDYRTGKAYSPTKLVGFSGSEGWTYTG